MIRQRVVLSTLFLLATLANAHALTVLNRGNGSEPKSLDPAYVNTVAESNILGDVLMGLTTLDAAARPIPGVAERWEISKDGKTWSFHLRKSLWSDGKPVTAQDFVFAWQREVNPKTAAPYAYNLWVLKNARAISNGKMPPASLGVRAVDDLTLVVQLEHPAAYLPELLTHDTAYPVPRHVVLAKGDGWARPENYVGNGAYVPAEWILNDHITLKKNPRFYDTAHVRIDEVNYFAAEDSQSALKRLRAGELDTQSPIPATSIDWLRKNMPNALRTAPFLAVSYFALNTTHAPLNDVRVRKALNLAFDREAVTDKVLRFGDKPAYGIVPPGVANFPGGATMDFKPLAMDAHIALAQTLMQQAGYGAGNRLRLVLETTHDPDNRRVAAVMQAMLRAIFIDLEIQQVDLQVHYRNMQIGSYEIASAVWIADAATSRSIPLAALAQKLATAPFRLAHEKVQTAWKDTKRFAGRVLRAYQGGGIKDASKEVVHEVSERLVGTYKKLEGRYGKVNACLMIAAWAGINASGALITPKVWLVFPSPMSQVVGIAEGIRKVVHKFGRKATENAAQMATKATPEGITWEEFFDGVRALARQMALASGGKEGPALSDEDVLVGMERMGVDPYQDAQGGEEQGKESQQGNDAQMSAIASFYGINPFTLTPGQKLVLQANLNLGTHAPRGGVTDEDRKSILFLAPEAVLIGVTHGEEISIPEAYRRHVHDIAIRHGFWHEGIGEGVKWGEGTERTCLRSIGAGEVENHGSYDARIALGFFAGYTLFSNIEVNKDTIAKVTKLSGATVKDILFQALVYGIATFQGQKLTDSQAARVLSVAEEDGLELSRPREEVFVVLRNGEAKMWPDDSSDVNEDGSSKSPLGEYAFQANSLRRNNVFAIARDQGGVFFMGGDHLPAFNRGTFDPDSLDINLGTTGADARGHHHAPKGGITIKGKDFGPGQFIPPEDFAEATPNQKAQILGKGEHAKNAVFTQKGYRPLEQVFYGTGEKREVTVQVKDAKGNPIPERDDNGKILKKKNGDTVYKTKKEMREYTPRHFVFADTGKTIPDDMEERLTKFLHQQIPQDWTGLQVAISEDEEAHVRGINNQGIWRICYLKKATKANEANKHVRVKQLMMRIPKVRKQFFQDISGPDREEAAVLSLICMTGLRVGGEKAAKKENPTHGASTLLREHVSIQGDRVSFDMETKDNVPYNETIHSKELADLLRPFVNRARRGERLFNTNDNKCLDYVHKTVGEEFRVHDFRDVVANETALQAMRTIQFRPGDDLDEAKHQVGLIVGKRLNHKKYDKKKGWEVVSSTSLDDYILPDIFHSWTEIAGAPVVKKKRTKSEEEETLRRKAHAFQKSALDKKAEHGENSYQYKDARKAAAKAFKEYLKAAGKTKTGKSGSRKATAEPVEDLKAAAKDKASAAIKKVNYRRGDDLEKAKRRVLKMVGGNLAKHIPKDLWKRWDAASKAKYLTDCDHCGTEQPTGKGVTKQTCPECGKETSIEW